MKNAIVVVAMGCRGDGVYGGFAINVIPNTFLAVSPCNLAGIVLARKSSSSMAMYLGLRKSSDLALLSDIYFDFPESQRSLGSGRSWWD